jgi:hypothetical protein
MACGSPGWTLQSAKPVPVAAFDSFCTNSSRLPVITPVSRSSGLADETIETVRLARRCNLWARIGWPYLGILQSWVALLLDCQFLFITGLVCRADARNGDSGGCNRKWFSRHAVGAAVWNSDGLYLASRHHDNCLAIFGRGSHNTHIMSAAHDCLQQTALCAGPTGCPIHRWAAKIHFMNETLVWMNR